MPLAEPTASSPPPSPRSAARSACRAIETADLPAVQRLLEQGFAGEPAGFWAHALAQYGRARPLAGQTPYGYLLEAEGRVVGVILVSYAWRADGTPPYLRGNIGSWYVEPPWRSQATLLTSRAHAPREASYLQLTPAPHVVPIVLAQGYRRYAQGTCASLPWLAPPRPGLRLARVTAPPPTGPDLGADECALLADHHGYGCISLVCSVDGQRLPFVFTRRWAPTRYGRLPCARLVYCRSLESFAACAGPLGRYLALRGLPIVFFDADGPLPGVPGRYRAGTGRFVRGPQTPRLGDLAYTEVAMFAF